RRRAAMPVLLAGREPHDITGVDLFDWAAFVLGPAAAGGHDEDLAERMRMPRGASAWVEGDAGGSNPCWIRLERRVDPYRAGEPVRRAFCGRLRANSFDIHICGPLVNM